MNVASDVAKILPPVPLMCVRAQRESLPKAFDSDSG